MKATLNHQQLQPRSPTITLQGVYPLTLCPSMATPPISWVSAQKSLPAQTSGLKPFFLLHLALTSTRQYTHRLVTSPPRRWAVGAGLCPGVSYCPPRVPSNSFTLYLLPEMPSFVGFLLRTNSLRIGALSVLLISESSSLKHFLAQMNQLA